MVASEDGGLPDGEVAMRKQRGLGGRERNRLAAAMKPDGVLESCLYADDLAAAETFYVRVLGLDVIAREAGRHVFFRCGAGVVLVFNAAVTSTQTSEVAGASIPLHGAVGAGHVAFRVAPANMNSWREHLQRVGVAIESEVRWPQGGHSIYFRDPAGNSLELATPVLWNLP